jgi:F-type H+-transporting ATPase subunit d
MSKSLGKINWGGLSTKLRPETLAAVSSFKRDYEALSKKLLELQESSTTIDWNQYSSISKTKVFSEAKKSFDSFNPKKLDLESTLKSIGVEETAAVKSAKETSAAVEKELKELKQLMVDIESARPIEQLTVDDVSKAIPDLDAKVEKMVKRGQWNPPKYYETFGEFKIGF